jgi:hypothetical protein
MKIGILIVDLIVQEEQERRTPTYKLWVSGHRQPL